jgi:hypothetical protein
LFKDLPADKTGLYFENRISNSEEFNMIDYLYYYDGGGVAIGDINNDGLSDVYLVSNEGENALFLNQGNMKFRDISQTAGVQSAGKWKTGVSMVDINADGLLDIYLCRLGNYKGITGRNELYVNQGDLTFREEAEKYNLDFAGFSTQAAFFDADNDGDLDAYLLNHSVHSRGSMVDKNLSRQADSLAGDRLYRNDDNYFTDVSDSSGIYQSNLGYGLGIGLSDINGDGYTDIYIANDFTENDFLYLNNQDWTFTEVYQESVDYSSLSSMGCDLADFNNDGLVDIITLDMLPATDVLRKSTVGEDPMEIFNMKVNLGYMPQYKRNTLQLNRSNGNFSDIAMMAGIHATDWSWAPLFADFNNDGWKDLFISNGIKGRPNDLDYLKFINSSAVLGNPEIPDSVLLNQMPSGRVSNYLYQNNTDLTFRDVSTEWGVVRDLITQGVAYGDLDNDGDLDLVLNNLDTLASIKENTSNTDTSAHYLVLELKGASKNVRAIGAKVEVYYEDNFQFYELFPVRGFKSSVDQRLHIGLGSCKAVDSIRITWPGGVLTTHYDLNADQLLKLSADDGQVTRTEVISPKPLFEKVSNAILGIDYVHRENNFVEFNREPLIPHMHSREGPAVAVADVNGDGLEDFYIGGAKHQEGVIYQQLKKGFVALEIASFVADKQTEDVAAAFLDFDNDGDQDLVVVSGGNEFQGASPHRQPRLYLNDGQGNFSKRGGVFEGIYQTGSCIAVYDFDQDGWQDLFLGSQVTPWNYGVEPQSYLLRNDGGRKFLDQSNVLPNRGVLGMINDAKWVDLNAGGRKSLVLAGEWIEVTILDFIDHNLQLRTIQGSSGWWKSIDHMDYDGDGDQDLLLGNMGLNSKLKASEKEPIHLYLNDIDQNGKLDAVLTYVIGNKEYMFASREMLNRQVPSLKGNFPTAKSYAEAPMEDILGQDYQQEIKQTAHELRSGVYINNGDNFDFVPFPNIMQISFIQDFLIDDLTDDGVEDLFSAGNLLGSSVQQGMYASDRGAVLTGLPNEPNVIPNGKTGIFLKGDIRQIERLNYKGASMIMVAVNNDSITWYKPSLY